MRIGVLGATGPAGRGLAARLADVGYDVLAGSRERVKAEAVIDGLREKWGERVARITPANNQAACNADMVVLAVHADAALATAKYFADELADKIVVSMANNLVRNGDEFNAVLPPHGSIAKEMQALLWRSRVVTGFHLVPAAEFVQLDNYTIPATNVLLSKLWTGCYVGIATHDEQLIAEAKRYAKAHGIAPDRFEFQMLYGVRRDLQERLVEEGYRMRVYVPFGTQWYPYLMRRLAERPANVMFITGNVVRETLGGRS